jgi:hypothetical protein
LDENKQSKYNKKRDLIIKRLELFKQHVETYKDQFIYEETADYLIDRINFIINNFN